MSERDIGYALGIILRNQAEIMAALGELPGLPPRNAERLAKRLRITRKTADAIGGMEPVERDE